VDDEPHVLDALRRILHERRNEWDVCFACNGREAQPEAEVRALIRAETGRHFDPEVCAAFEKAHDQFRAARAWFPDNFSSPL